MSADRRDLIAEIADRLAEFATVPRPVAVILARLDPDAAFRLAEAAIDTSSAAGSRGPRA